MYNMYVTWTRISILILAVVSIKWPGLAAISTLETDRIKDVVLKEDNEMEVGGVKMEVGGVEMELGGDKMEVGGDKMEVIILYLKQQLEKVIEEREEDRSRVQDVEHRLEQYHSESIRGVAESVQLRQHMIKNLERIEIMEEQKQENRDDIDILIERQRTNDRDIRRFHEYKERSAKRFHQLERKVQHLEGTSDSLESKLSHVDLQILNISDDQLQLWTVTSNTQGLLNETVANVSTCCDNSFAYAASISTNQDTVNFIPSNQNSGILSNTNDLSTNFEPGSGELDDELLSIIEEMSNKVGLGSGEIQAELESSGEVDGTSTSTDVSLFLKRFVPKDVYVSQILKRDLQLLEISQRFANLSGYVEKLETKLSSIQLGSFMSNLQASLINFTQNVITLDQWRLASNELVNSSLENQDKIFRLTNMIMDNKNKMADLQWQTDQAEVISSQQFNILRMFVIRLNNSVEDIKEELASNKGRQSTIYPSGYEHYSQGPTLAGLETLKTRVEDLGLQILYNQNRLGNLEVKVINETLFQCQKYNIDNLQEAKLLEHHDRLTTNTESILLLNELVQTVDSNIYELSALGQNNSRNLRAVRSGQRSIQSIVPVIVNMQKELENLKLQLPTDCHGYYLRGYRDSGVYAIRSTGRLKLIQVFCEMLDTGGWTVIQRRVNDSTPFKETWKRYKWGFGSTETDFWLGNEYIHLLTSPRNYSLYIEMTDINDMKYFSTYKIFRIASEDENYSLDISGYYGNSTDAFEYSNGAAFSTPDRDNDISSTHCAFFYEAGWWYRHCQSCNLNGRYTIGITWLNTDINDWLQLKHTVMRIKPV